MILSYSIYLLSSTFTSRNTSSPGVIPGVILANIYIYIYIPDTTSQTGFLSNVNNSKKSVFLI